MKRILALFATIGVAAFGNVVSAANLLSNGSLDATHPVEVSPGFFLPHPDVWINVGSKTLSGLYQDDLSSETWAGPPPTPDTNPNDNGVFYKAFGGNLGTGDLATGHLYQDVAGAAGVSYMLTGWAGAEANYSGLIAGSPTRTRFAIEFLNAANALIGSSILDLAAAGLGVSNGQPFNYKEYSVSGVAPAGTVTVRSSIWMIDGYANPAGGGQAFVVDDFSLVAVPEPSVLGLALLGLGSLAAFRFRK